MSFCKGQNSCIVPLANVLFSFYCYQSTLFWFLPWEFHPFLDFSYHSKCKQIHFFVVALESYKYEFFIKVFNTFSISLLDCINFCTRSLERFNSTSVYREEGVHCRFDTKENLPVWTLWQTSGSLGQWFLPHVLLLYNLEAILFQLLDYFRQTLIKQQRNKYFRCLYVPSTEHI